MKRAIHNYITSVAFIEAKTCWVASKLFCY